MYRFWKFNLLRRLGKTICQYISKIDKSVNILYASHPTFKNLSQENSPKSH